MHRLASGIVIAIAALAINGSFVRDALGEEPVRLQPSLSSSSPVASGHRSERVLSLVLALEALRAAPAVLAAPPKG
jgi:hypothetical protein